MLSRDKDLVNIKLKLKMRKIGIILVDYLLKYFKMLKIVLSSGEQI